MKLTVLKGVQYVYHRPDGTRVFVYPPKKNRPTRAFTKAKSKHVTGVKQHYTHELRVINKAMAPNRRY